MATTQAKNKKTTKKPAAKKPAASKAAASKVAKPQQEARREHMPDSGAWREVTGVVLFGLGLVIAYFITFDGGSGAGLAVQSVLKGLAGVLHYLVPVLFCWAGILTMFSRKRNAVSIWYVLMVLLLVLCVSAGVHVFKFDQITQKMRFFKFSAFVDASYQFKTGGAGVLGAILSWPLYHSLGLRAAGTIIILICLIIADLVLLRKISLVAIGEKFNARFDRMRESYHQRQDNRVVEEKLSTKRPRDRDMDELENWSGGNVPLEASRTAEAPPLPTRIEPVREMEVPKFNSNKQPKRQVPKVELAAGEARALFAAEQPGIIDAVPKFLKKRTAKHEASQPEIIIEEPKPMSMFIGEPEPLQEELDEPTVSGLVSGTFQFPSDGELQDVNIGDNAIEEPLVMGINDMDDDDDEPPLVMLDEVLAPAKIAADVKPDLSKLPIARPAQKPAIIKIEEEAEVYNYPPLDLLHASKPSSITNQDQIDQEKAKVLIQTLESFGIQARLIGIAHGPTVTRFELSPAAGVKVSRITSLADDIALNLAAISVRIEAPIPGKAAVGVEVPNDHVEIVPLRDVLESNEARRHPSRLATALGRDNAGRYIVADLAKMPHVLIAGATGAGKSVCINCIICSILYRATPDEVKLIMIDPKVVELSAYNGIPHLLVPVVTDPKKAASALEWAVVEMNTRYKKFAEVGVRDMKGYNQRRKEGEPLMPQIVIIIDELADLMMVTPGEVEDSICRLAQLARAAGIHLVIATQRPSVNVITGVIKANIPSRVAFTVASQVDSRTILDVGGAEKLLGRGDMLFAPSGTNKPMRVQGTWVSDDEVRDIVDYIKELHAASYDEDIIEHMEHAQMSDAEKDDQAVEYDDLLPQAVEICVEAGQASISMLQRRLRVGYARAGRLIDEMASRGIVSQAEGAKPRNVMMTREQYKMMFED